MNELLCLCFVLLCLTSGLAEEESKCPTVTGHSYFKCRRGEPRCIDSLGTCNGVTECSDGSDESPDICRRQHDAILSGSDNELGTERLNCDHLTSFTCRQGGLVRCLPFAHKCDGHRDCDSDFDEQPELCALLQSGTFTAKRLQSRRSATGAAAVARNGAPPASRCGAGQRQCANGQCKAARLWCNGIRECADGSDELNCQKPESTTILGPTTRSPLASCAREQYECSRRDAHNQKAVPILCIPKRHLCDYIVDCPSGDDEDVPTCSVRTAWPRDVCASGEDHCQGLCRALNTTAEQLREWRDSRERQERLMALADPTHEQLASRAELDEFVRGGGSVEDLRASLWRTRGTHGTHECSCARGFELNADGLRCDNINECAVLNGNCSHKCTDLPGSVECSCANGYRLDPIDKRSCRASDTSQLFLLALHDNELHELRLTHLLPQVAREAQLSPIQLIDQKTVALLRDTGSEAVALEMDALRDLVFWVSRRANAQVFAAPIQLSIQVNAHRKRVEDEFRLYLQKTLAPKLMMGQSVRVDDAFLREEFARFERDVLAKELWYEEFVVARGQRLSLDGADDPTKNLSRVIFDCSYIQRLVPHVDRCFFVGLGFDWFNMILYIADYETSAVWAVSLNSSHFVPVVQYRNLSDPTAFDKSACKREVYQRLTAFAMDPHDGYLLYAVSPCRGSAATQLLRANLDGSDPRVLITASSAFPMEYIAKLTIDSPGGRFYVVSWPHDIDSRAASTALFVGSCASDGSDCRRLLQFSHRAFNLSHSALPYGISVFEDVLYLVDMNANALLTCNKLDCATTLRVLQRGTSKNPLRDVSVFTTYRQPDTGRFGPCLTLGDECRYMCVPFGGRPVGKNGKPYRCVCPIGQVTSSDAVSCVEVYPPAFPRPPAATGKSGAERDQSGSPAGSAHAITSDESAMSSRTAVFVLLGLFATLIITASLVAVVMSFMYRLRTIAARRRLASVDGLTAVPPANVASATQMVALVKEIDEPRDVDADLESSSDSETGPAGDEGLQQHLPNSSSKVTFAIAAEARDPF